jgi:hypothetical protein
MSGQPGTGVVSVDERALDAAAMTTRSSTTPSGRRHLKRGRRAPGSGGTPAVVRLRLASDVGGYCPLRDYPLGPPLSGV